MKWLSGLAAWVLGVIAGGVMIGVSVVPPSVWSSDTARPAVEALEKRSVYVDPEAREVLDEAEARRVIDDRNILVVVFPGREADRTVSLCEEIIEVHSHALALVYAGTAGPTICTGGYHHVPLPDGSDEWAEHIQLAAEFAREASGALDDVPTELTEYVRAYDVAVRADLPWGAPPRHEERIWGTWKDVFDALGGMACGVLMLFWCAVVAFWRFAAARDAWRARRVARAEALAEERT